MDLRLRVPTKGVFKWIPGTPTVELNPRFDTFSLKNLLPTLL
jgi:hypothetical protein